MHMTCLLVSWNLRMESIHWWPNLIARLASLSARNLPLIPMCPEPCWYNPAGIIDDTDRHRILAIRERLVGHCKPWSLGRNEHISGQHRRCFKQSFQALPELRSISIQRRCNVRTSAASFVISLDLWYKLEGGGLQQQFTATKPTKTPGFLLVLWRPGPT